MFSLSQSQRKRAPYVVASTLLLLVIASLLESEYGVLRGHRHISRNSISNRRLSSLWRKKQWIKNHPDDFPLFDPKTVTSRPDAPYVQQEPVGSNLERDVTMCVPVSEEQTLALQGEIAEYEKDARFHQKINEVKSNKPSRIHKSVDNFLRTKVLQPGWSVLELGCAAGMMLSMVQQHYEAAGQQYKEMVGIELVSGWVRFASEFFANRGIRIFEGDITDFALPEPKTFDFVMLNDVMEHVQKDRYGCLFEKLRGLTHDGSVVYAHMPNPTLQLSVQEDQYYENVLPAHFVFAGMAMAHFELVLYEPDTGIQCKRTPINGIHPSFLDYSPCNTNEFPNFHHAVFRRVEQHAVFDLA